MKLNETQINEEIPESSFYEEIDVTNESCGECEVRCCYCNKNVKIPINIFIHRYENGSICYKEFCSSHCFFEWMIETGSTFKEVKDKFNKLSSKENDKDQDTSEKGEETTLL